VKVIAFHYFRNAIVNVLKISKRCFCHCEASLREASQSRFIKVVAFPSTWDIINFATNALFPFLKITLDFSAILF